MSQSPETTKSAKQFILHSQEYSLNPHRLISFSVRDYSVINLLQINYKIITLHLPKVPKKEEECATEIEKWLHLLIQMTRMENITLRKQRAIFKKLLEVGNVAALNEHDRAQYECNLKHCAVFMSQLEYAQMQGEEIGLEKGREEGRKEGREEGREEEKRQTAIKMRAKGVASSIIADCTGLPIDQIENL